MLVKNSIIKKTIVSLFISGLIMSYPLYVAYQKDNGGIFLDLIIILISIINLLATIVLSILNLNKKQRLNAAIFIMVLSLYMVVILVCIWEYGMVWQYYLILISNIFCFLGLLIQLKRGF